ncbi:hypothetical protein [Sphingomonas sp.]|uniref:hypothetical protein n=1 Tax=Sphingomonas sp. TaxID=28214 RepID=UPI002DD63627|nr:hypothetical protein [Sphingomonas sp.]
MPYRHAWLFIAALIGATIFAFWRSYFGRLGDSPVGFHIHGITASFWMSLLLTQSWTPHHGHLAVHRSLGLATFAAVPLFAAGSMGVIHSMAIATIAGNPFYALWGGPLAFIDALAFGGFLYAVAMALRHRRNVRLHAGYMLSTSLMLVSPVLGRVFNQTVPGMIVRGPPDFPVFGISAQAGNLTAAIIALWLWRRDPRFGRPWAIAFGICVVQTAGFEAVDKVPPWQAAFLTLGAVPLSVMLAVGLTIGIVAVAIGWAGGMRPRGAVPVRA